MAQHLDQQPSKELMANRLGKGLVADLAFSVIFLVAMAFIEDISLAWLVAMGAIIAAYLVRRFVFRREAGASPKE